MPSRRSYIYFRACAVIGPVLLGLSLIIVISYINIFSKRDSGNQIERFKLEQSILKHELQQNYEYSGELQELFQMPRETTIRTESCSMDTCFDLSRCKDEFRVHVYPVDSKDKIKSSIYLKIVQALQTSKYYTADPQTACIFVLSVDTIDRDRLSTDYVHSLEKKIHRLPSWYRGRNHVIFNLFSGTWPDYKEDLGFDFGLALNARASMSSEKFRTDFDVSLPLFAKDHPLQDRTEKQFHIFPLKRKYLLGFKGKRYLFGIGSETRNALHLINNRKDIVLLTTCKHGKGWEKYSDERCSEDNSLYDRYDYQELLINATFCLVPRGRRLGSFRFLESLQVGCIPVIMSNGWELPFSNVIDWSTATIRVDERSLLQLPSILKSINEKKILQMRQQALFLWKAYFSSVEKIVHTSLEIINQRINPAARSYLKWNYPPGALFVYSKFSTNLADFPFYYVPIGSEPKEKFTAMILAVSSVRYASSPLFRLIQSINQSEHVDQILVVWLAPSRIPDRNQWPKTKASLRVIHPGRKSLNSRYIDKDIIQTNAVFSFDEDVVISQDEIDFAFKVWKSFPERLVGFTPRTHSWDNESNAWIYSAEKSNDFSMILPSCAVYHRYYNYLYSNHLPQAVHEIVDQMKNCEDIAMNFLISHVIDQPPIRVANSSHFRTGKFNKEILGLRTSSEEHFEQKQTCFREFLRIFGKAPLKYSAHKFDPLLYKDPVSNFRKRYRFLEI